MNDATASTDERSCQHEHAVIEAVRSGRWEAALTAHLATCALCRRTQALSAAFGGIAAETERLPHRLPEYRALWLRSRLERRMRAERRRAMIMMLTSGAAMTCVLLVAFWKWQAIASNALRLGASAGNSAGLAPRSLAVLLAGALLIWLVTLGRGSAGSR